MLDWNNNGIIDPTDIGISIALQNSKTDNPDRNDNENIDQEKFQKGTI